MFMNRNEDARIVVQKTDDRLFYRPLPQNLQDEANNIIPRNPIDYTMCEIRKLVQLTPLKSNVKKIDEINDESSDESNSNFPVILNPRNNKVSDDTLEALATYKSKYADFNTVYNWRGTKTISLKFTRKSDWRYSLLPWADNSCAVNSFADCLLMLYMEDYKNSQLREAFVKSIPNFTSIIDAYIFGQISNIDAHELILILFELSDNTDFLDIHDVTDKLFDTIQTSDLSSNLFARKYVFGNICDKCNVNSSVDSYKKIYCSNYIMMKTEYLTIQECVLDTFSVKRTITCKECNKSFKSQYKTLALPNIIYVSYPTCYQRNATGDFVKTFEPIEYVDDYIEVENIKYRLVTCIYGNQSHFIMKYRHNNVMFTGDGMRRKPNHENNAFEAMSEIDFSLSKFPGMLNDGKCLCALMYLRQTFLK
jgi:hypothetical protein